jgi:hypothetical protein
MKRLTVAAMLVVSLVLLSGPAPATAAWHEPVSGPNAVSSIGSEAEIASINGLPYAAWQEVHGSNSQLFVARLNAAGTGWERVGGPVNADLTHNVGSPSLADVGGVPYVAWLEDDGTNREVRVARLNAAGNGWEEPWRGVDATHGGINQDASKDGHLPRLASIGGVPFVAWDESDGTNTEIRVARLDSSTHPFPTWVQSWTGVSATSGGVNQSTTRYGYVADLASINNTPYVAWRESDSSKYQLRVARLNAGSNGWEQPWAGVSASSGGINDPTHDTSFDEPGPSLASINGFPYVAWTDSDGTNKDARVARLDTSAFPAPTWKQEAAGVSGTDGRINQSPTDPAVGVRIVSVEAAQFGVAVPYVAWVEFSGTLPNEAYQLRVARFASATHTWEQAWPGVSQTYGGVNESPSTKQRSPSLASVRGVPYIASQFYPGGGIQVTRLEPEFTSQSATPTGAGATLSASAHTYGIPYPIGFQYGTALGSEVAAAPAPAGSDNVSVSRQVAGLMPGTTYQFRPFATAGAPAPRVLGTTMSFTTKASTTTTPSTTTTLPGSVLAAVAEEQISPSVFPAAPSGPSALAGKRRRYGTKVSFKLNEAATVRFTVTQRTKGRRVKRGKKTVCVKPTKKNRKRKACTRVVTLKGSFSRTGAAGKNSFHFTGRLNGRKLKPGRYRLVATPTAGGKRGKPTSSGFRIVR